MWLCVSMIPGMTKRPDASITSIPGSGMRSGPIAVIVPFFTRIDVAGNVFPVAVSTVPPFTRMLPPVWMGLARRSSGNSTGCSNVAVSLRETPAVGALAG